jgi:ferredoxin-NADP reductase
MQLQVTTIKTRALRVKSFQLRSPNGALLPHFEPGSHIRVTIPGLEQKDPTRAYSLVSDPLDLTHYEIAILRVEGGGGGSEALHQRVRAGDLLDVSPPRCDFRIDESAAHSLLIAGGIGITPILSLTRELVLRGKPFELHYVARGTDSMPYREVISALARDRANFHETRVSFDLAGILGRIAPDTHVYVCGPHSLLEEARERSRFAGLHPSRLHFEPFGYRRMPGDAPVELELLNSGITVHAHPGRPLLEAIEAAGIWAPADCRRGECGACVLSVAEGAGDHRDHCLTPEMRSHSICPCVSWVMGSRLAVNL